MASSETTHLHALVDIGSNGIRFSITSLSSETARNLPTLYQDRANISLYDVQHETPGQKSPIPESTIKDVTHALSGFKTICKDFEVLWENIRVVATEATREALNSAELCERITEATGWSIETLAKEEEGRLGALGIASSFHSLEGLLLDLGGGSVQITWIIMNKGTVRMSPRAVSLPYGAAALKHRLGQIKHQSGDNEEREGEKELKAEISQALSRALTSLEIPEAVLNRAKTNGGLNLYLSGGGFRGWGYLLMTLHPIQPYPIPTINGFSLPASGYHPSTVMQSFHNSSTTTDKTFRLSKRRISQLPAISLLMDVLIDTFPPISRFHFAQGGLREGILFSSLSSPTQEQHPLLSATQPHAQSYPLGQECPYYSTQVLTSLLDSSIPKSFILKMSKINVPPSTPRNPPQATHSEKDPQGTNTNDEHPLPHLPTLLLQDAILYINDAISSLLFAHSSLPKDIRPSAALRCTTTGLLAGAHGLNHQTRAILALALYHRWAGAKSGSEELPPTDRDFYAQLVELVGGWAAWWAGYVGIVAMGLGDAFPAGKIQDWESAKERWNVEVEKWDGQADDDGGGGGGGGGGDVVVVRWRGKGRVGKWAEELEKWGKRRRWVMGMGVKVKVRIGD